MNYWLCVREERMWKNVFVLCDIDECRMNIRKRNIDELRMVVCVSIDIFKFG